MTDKSTADRVNRTSVRKSISRKSRPAASSFYKRTTVPAYETTVTLGPAIHFLEPQ